MTEYDRTRVEGDDAVHSLSKELNEMLAALIKGKGDKAKESIDLVTQLPQFVGMDTTRRKEMIIKSLMFNVLDELMQHFEEDEDAPSPT